jgi:hypothetical protein
VVVTPWGEILERSRLEGESVLWTKDRGSARLSVQDPPTTLLAKPVDETLLLELRTGLQRERVAKGVTKPDVGKIGTVELHAECHVIERNPKAALFSGHLGGKQVHSNPYLSQKPRKRRVELVAEPSAPLFHNLVKNALLIEHDRDASPDVQILERDLEKMLFVDPRQPAQIVSPDIGKAEPLEVALSVHRLLGGGNHTGPNGRMSNPLRGFQPPNAAALSRPRRVAILYRLLQGSI